MELILRAAGSGVAKENPTPEEEQKSINKAVAKFLENFPPTATPST